MIAVSPARRARHRLRTYLSERPALYLPLARRRYPGPSPEVIGPDTEFVIDGYTRCASTFAVYALQLSQQRPVRLAHHLHVLSTRFEEVAMPPEGRYVRHAAYTDDNGTIWVPPAIPDARPKIIAALALTLAGMAIARAALKQRALDD